MKRHTYAFTLAVALSAPLWTSAQTPKPTMTDPVLQRIWELGMDSSQTYPLAQALMDSIGPRLTGSPGQKAGIEWLLSRYKSWGIVAHKEQYDSVPGWRRGPTHVDLLTPRVRTLEGTMLAGSPGTGGKPVEGDVITLPADTTQIGAWLKTVKGKFVLMSRPQATCRPDDDWKQWALPASFQKMQAERQQARAAWKRRVPQYLAARLESAGAAGVLTANWSEGWGVDKVFTSRTERIPNVQLSCEDYGLVARLAEHQQGPRIRLNAESEALGSVPVDNTLAEIKGRDKPNEYVLLSAHFDSWDGASGATDNGTGTIVMLEAMRILKAVYPTPKRTILVGHWSGEEQGVLGSIAFVKAHPDIVAGLHASFNQDDGTGRTAMLSGEGLPAAQAYFTKWLAQIPEVLTKDITRVFPGEPTRDGSDNASFNNVGAPGLNLAALPWNYDTYTWHTNRDTFDKISFDDLKINATLAAMLVYLASEDAVKLPRK